MTISFDIAKMAFIQHQALCNQNCAATKESHALTQIWSDYFMQIDLECWTLGAIIFGSRYYAKFIDSGTITRKNLKDAMKLFKLEQISQLAYDLADGKFTAADFKNEV